MTEHYYEKLTVYVIEIRDKNVCIFKQWGGDKMTVEDLKEGAIKRLKMFGYTPDVDLLLYCTEIASQKSADWCNYDNIDSLPDGAKIYVIDCVAAEYMISKPISIMLAEKLRRDAETGLLRFRRLRW